MRRLIGDEKWERLPRRRRAARRAEGAAMVGELADLAATRRGTPTGSRCRSSPCAVSGRRPPSAGFETLRAMLPTARS